MELAGSIGPAVVGAVSALAFALLLRKFLPTREATLWAWSLVGAAVVYVGFALWRGRGLPAELAGVLGFTGLALVGFTRGERALGAAWIVHALWDIPLHTHVAPGIAPSAYPPFCASFDVAAGVFLLLAARPRKTT